MIEGSNLETITAMALNPDNTRIAVSAIEFDEGDYDYKSYIFVISAADGGYISKMARV